MKIFFIILIILFVLLLCFLVFLIISTNKRDKIHLPNEQLLKGDSDKSALIIYQPSIHNGNISIFNSISVFLNQHGYSITTNYPSSKIKYKLSSYNVIIFGSGVYVGKSAVPLSNYLKANKKYTKKNVFIFLTGSDVTDTKELGILKNLIPTGNNVSTLKIQKNETDKVTDFIKEHLQL